MSEYDTKVPVLSTDGWMTNTSLIIEQIFLYYLTGYYKQSNFFMGRVYTIKEALMESSRDSELYFVKEKIISSLKELYSCYFDVSGINVSVDTQKRFDSKEELWDLIIDVVIKVSDTEEYKLSQTLIANSSGVILNMATIKSLVLNNESSFE